MDQKLPMSFRIPLKLLEKEEKKDEEEGAQNLHRTYSKVNLPNVTDLFIRLQTYQKACNLISTVYYVCSCLLACLLVSLLALLSCILYRVYTETSEAA